MTCPQCSSTMIASPALPVREIVKAMVVNGATPFYAQNFADTHHEKQSEHGVTQTCPNCRYVTRAAATGTKGKREAS